MGFRSGCILQNKDLCPGSFGFAGVSLLCVCSGCWTLTAKRRMGTSL